MNAREAIAEAIRYGGRATAINKALFVIEGLRARGFVILPKSEVEAIRDKALEEAAKIFDGGLGGSVNRRNVAVTIRKLKSGGE